MRRVTGWTCASALLTALLVSGASGQGAVDPQQLVGIWVGVWTFELPARDRVSAPYELTITSVEGAQVVGRTFSGGTRGRDERTTFPEGKIELGGKLDGNRLTYGSGITLTELSIDGDRMEGTRAGRGTTPIKILLKKK